MTKETLRVDSRGLLIRKDPLPAPEGPWSTADILDYGVSAHPEKPATSSDVAVRPTWNFPQTQNLLHFGCPFSFTSHQNIPV